ncbi:MAG TPA: hypothetical protein VGO67_06010 [Verrucomicrobiae bacterium]|jgi:hypothetical protein
MNKTLLSKDKGWAIDGNQQSTFGGEPSFYSLSGPGSLVRLVQIGKTNYYGLQLEPSHRDGAFWFDGDFFQRLSRDAREDLLRQQAGNKQPFSRPLNDLVGNYLRHWLRNYLAVSYDWTMDFDAYVRLRLEPGDALVAAVGPVAEQSAYSPQDPSYAATKNIKLTGKGIHGQAIQYMVNFRIPANTRFTQRIHGPFLF